MVQRLGLHAFTSQGSGSILGQGTKIHMPFSIKKKKEKRQVLLSFPFVGKETEGQRCFIAHGHSPRLPI